MTAHNFNVDRGSGPHCAIARRDSRAMWGTQTGSKHHLKATTSGNNDWALGLDLGKSTWESVDPSGVNQSRGDCSWADASRHALAEVIHHMRLKGPWPCSRSAASVPPHQRSRHWRFGEVSKRMCAPCTNPLRLILPYGIVTRWAHGTSSDTIDH